MFTQNNRLKNTSRNRTLQKSFSRKPKIFVAEILSRDWRYDEYGNAEGPNGLERDDQITMRMGEVYFPLNRILKYRFWAVKILLFLSANSRLMPLKKVECSLLQSQEARIVV